MPASFSELLGNIRRIDIPKADGSPGIFVQYRPQSVTPRKLHEWLALIAQAEDAQASGREEKATAAIDAVTEELAAILLDWDLLDNDHHPVAPTLEGLQDVDLSVQSLILAAIREDSRMGKANGTPPSEPSDSTLPAKARRATAHRKSRNGSR